MMRRVMSVVAAASLAACATKTITSPAEPADGLRAGTYTLLTVNGASLPAVAGYDGSTAIDVLSGAIQLNIDHSFVLTSNIRTRGRGGIQIHADTSRGQFWYFGDMVVLKRGTDVNAYSVLDVADSRTLKDEDMGGLYRLTPVQ